MLQSLASPSQRRFDFARLLQPAQAGWVQREEVIMGTAIRVELWATRRSEGEAAAAAVMQEMHRIDRQMSPHKPASELCRINREAAARAVPLSDEMATLIERALAFSALTEGAFDISYAAAGRLYDYRARVRPGAAELAEACRSIGWQHLHLNRAAGTLRFGRPGMCIDLGGIAKGHAVDRAAALLRARGIEHAYVSAGGDSRVIGERFDPNGGRPWSVAIRHPRRAGEAAAVLPLVDVSISTSGDYERFFDDGAERVHHLIDPATGTSPHHVHSATVLAEDGVTSEALSKALFVMGPARGLPLLARVPGTDAVVVDAEGRLHWSDGLSAPTAPVAPTAPTAAALPQAA
jgi:FAD:protein FMN transferase